MPEPPAPRRFRWRREPHLPKSRRVIVWLRCRAGKAWFERQIKSREGSSRIPLIDPEILAALKERVAGFGVRGAKGAGIVLDEFEVPGERRVLLLASLADWRAFESRSGLPAD
ncbi:MAG: hypothetical protein Kow0069_39140 [Promethearchaeota archaeon]